MGSRKLGTIELVPKENFMIIKLHMIKGRSKTYTTGKTPYKKIK